MLVAEMMQDQTRMYASHIMQDQKVSYPKRPTNVAHLCTFVIFAEEIHDAGENHEKNTTALRILSVNTPQATPPEKGKQ